PVPELCHDPGFQERLHQRTGTLVLDPNPEAVHQCRMRDFVETGFDVGLEYPPVIDGLRCQVVDLGDRVMRTPVRAEPILRRNLAKGPWSQPVEAIELRLPSVLSARRSSANTSAGVLNPNIARGRPFISSATALR